MASGSDEFTVGVTRTSVSGNSRAEEQTAQLRKVAETDVGKRLGTARRSP